MEEQVSFSELEETTPFTTNLRGRVIPTGSIYDPNHDNENLPEFTNDEEWLNFIPDPNGNLSFYKGEPIEGVYFGKEPYEAENDLNFLFLELFYQRLTWPDIMGLLPQLLDDLRNLATSLTTLAIYQSSLSDFGFGIQRLVQTELEYMFFVSRSLYDGLQFISANTWDKIHAVDDDADFSADLPTSSFKKMALDGGEPISPSNLKEKYGIPEGLAEFYSNEAPVFQKLRNFRDAVAHQGDSPDVIFRTEEGLAIDTTSQPYSNFDAWESEQIDENDLAPLWPFVAYIVDHVFSAIDNFVKGLLEKPLHLPHELADGYDVYIRGHHIPNLKHLDQLMDSDSWGHQFVETVEERLQV